MTLILRSQGSQKFVYIANKSFYAIRKVSDITNKSFYYAAKFDAIANKSF
jgi:hypothetical protein